MPSEIESRIETILQSAGNLPTLPGIALRILEVVQREDTGLKEVGDVLRSDPPLATKVLQIANSSLYGMKVARVQHAVNILGGELIKNLVLGFSLIRNTSANKSDVFDYAQFWKDSLVTAISARWILQRRAPQLKENGFLLGLIHNIGTLFLVQCMPTQYSQVLQELRDGKTSQYEAEDRLLGVNHLQVGSYLADQWGFPNTLTLPIGYHHYPDLLPQNDEILTLTETLHFAAQFSAFFHARDKGFQLAVVQRIMSVYSFNGLMELDDLVAHVQEQTEDIFPIFELSIEDDLNYLHIVEEARQELIHTSQSFIEDYLAQQREIERLKILATHDPLTKVHNYQKFSEELDSELERVRRTGGYFSFCFVDIDDFKTVNDTYGHLVGDRVLQRIAEHLKNSVRKYDVVARYGGDEFALLMPELSAQRAFRAMERIRKTIAHNPTVVEDTSIPVTVSCGVFCVSPQTASDRNEVMRQADTTMYEAKHAKNKTLICRS
jgi:diguanylate cyclase (GGDEF)-like protein